MRRTRLPSLSLHSIEHAPTGPRGSYSVRISSVLSSYSSPRRVGFPSRTPPGFLHVSSASSARLPRLLLHPIPRAFPPYLRIVSCIPAPCPPSFVPIPIPSIPFLIALLPSSPSCQLYCSIPVYSRTAAAPPSFHALFPALVRPSTPSPHLRPSFPAFFAAHPSSPPHCLSRRDAAGVSPHHRLRLLLRLFARAPDPPPPPPSHLRIAHASCGTLSSIPVHPRASFPSTSPAFLSIPFTFRQIVISLQTNRLHRQVRPPPPTKTTAVEPCLERVFSKSE
ncbi:hypothetical protein B0H17DRAFT_1220720 [Mycena rosella]|uniref:Uncharacterized protein n=1 Tax=Mycena rosella TaxID=1033263 RepID=A0AAD7B885_MYCRO|nr:hypothetical protein B0H17DRAFT_1220720 [Mycena rosella]